MKLLLQHGADPNARTSGYAPLRCAASRGKVAEMRELLGAGANVNAPDDGGRTPWIAATGRGHIAAADPGGEIAKRC